MKIGNGAKGMAEAQAPPPPLKDKTTCKGDASSSPNSIKQERNRWRGLQLPLFILLHNYKIGTLSEFLLFPAFGRAIKLPLHKRLDVFPTPVWCDGDSSPLLFLLNAPLPLSHPCVTHMMRKALMALYKYKLQRLGALYVKITKSALGRAIKIHH